MVDADNTNLRKVKAYELPQELGDKLWKLRKEYFDENKNG